MTGLALVAGCSAPSGSTAGTSSAQKEVSGSAMQAAAQPAGDRLGFTASTLDGKPFDGQSLRGKPAVMWFWAAWCSICAREAPTVAKVAAANPGVTFVGVSALDGVPAMQKFVTDRGVGGFTHLADQDAAVWRRFGVTSQPAQAFISADGTVSVVPGPMSEQDLASRVNALSQP